ncbi:MAG TPA: serine/threonine-protein kinase [Polyangiaceae bacterium]|jgi:serine/threonine-protein kinase
MADDSHLPSPGDVIAGKYRIDRLVGRGGMGAVFAAQHLLLNQTVALKLLLGELAANSEATARFLNEARAAARIQGEHVARVLDIGQLPSGGPFMVLEYLEGADLADLLHKRGPLPVNEVADFALQALDALGQAHAAGIVHRDLKPANLFLARRHDGSSLVKVLDFGISKNLSPDSQGHGMTSTRAVIGSPEYMSPEQLRTPREVDTRTDIWSLGVILYELLTGQMPFKGESLPELFLAILETVPPAVRVFRPDVPPALEAIVARCMARDRNQRFPNVAELANALLGFASEQTRAIAAVRSSGALPQFQSSAPGLPSHGFSQPEVPALAARIRTANTAAPWANTGTGATAPPGSPRARVAAMIGVGAICLLVSFIAVTVVLKRALAPGVASGPLPATSTTVAASPAPPPPAAPAPLEPLSPSPAAAPAGHAPQRPAALAAAASALAAPPAAPTPAPPAPLPAVAPSAFAAQAAAVQAAAVQAIASAAHPHPLSPATPADATPAPAAPPKFVTIQPAPPPNARAGTSAPAAKNCSPNYTLDKDGNKHFKPECF